MSEPPTYLPMEEVRRFGGAVNTQSRVETMTSVGHNYSPDTSPVLIPLPHYVQSVIGSPVLTSPRVF